jgi:hypothetical protein
MGQYGGNPLPDSSFPLPDNPHTCKDEYAAFALSYSSQSNGYQVDVFLENRSAWPATVRNNYNYRYYFTLDSANISDVTVVAAQNGTISGPTLYDATNKIYYITNSFANTPVYPGNNHMVHGGFNMSTSSTWSAANDWSWGGTGATTPWDTSYLGGNNDHYYAANIEVYDGTTKLCGNAPGGGTPQPTGTPTRTFTPPAVTNTPTRTFTPPAVTNTPTRTFTPPAITNTPDGATATRTRTNTPGGATATRTRTPTRTNTVGGPTATRTRTPTPPAITNTPTRTFTPPAITNTPTRTFTPPAITNTPTITPTVGGACSPVTSDITAPFTFDGAGNFCWRSTNLGGYINSWNTTSVTLNGVNATNLYVASGSYPAKIGGYWYVAYTSSVSWGPFETK